jgi:hypothetical protein
LAEKTLVTALAHAIVLKEFGKKKKNVSQGDLAEKLARGNEIVKQVYRYTQQLSAESLNEWLIDLSMAANCQITISSCPPCSLTVSMAYERHVN